MLPTREATLADIPDMRRIRLSVRENRLRDPSWLTQELFVAHLAPAGAANTWVVDADDGVAGFAVARLAERDVWALFVDAAHEGRGVGTALLHTATSWLFEHGVDEVSLNTAPGTRADDFYRRAGWRRGESAPNGDVYYRMARPTADAAGLHRTPAC